MIPASTEAIGQQAFPVTQPGLGTGVGLVTWKNNPGAHRITQQG